MEWGSYDIKKLQNEIEALKNEEAKLRAEYSKNLEKLDAEFDNVFETIDSMTKEDIKRIDDLPRKNWTHRLTSLSPLHLGRMLITKGTPDIDLNDLLSNSSLAGI